MSNENTMSKEQLHQDIINRVYKEFYNEGKYEIADELFDENVVYHEHSKDLFGREGMINYVQTFVETVPDATNVLNDVIVEGDNVTTKWVITGTTVQGEPVKFEGTTGYKFSNGKIIEKRDM